MNSNLSIASSVSQGITTDVALIAVGVNVAPQQAAIKLKLGNHLVWESMYNRNCYRGEVVGMGSCCTF